MTRVEAVIHLARKYDCPGMLYTIKSVLRGAVVDRSLDQLEIFIPLSQFEDVTGCVEGIRRYGSLWMASGSRGSLSKLDEPISERSWANPASWDYARASRATSVSSLRCSALFKSVPTLNSDGFIILTARGTILRTNSLHCSNKPVCPLPMPLLCQKTTAVLVQAGLLTTQPSLTVRHRLTRRPISLGHRRVETCATRTRT
jgi:hypothetical protein